MHGPDPSDPHPLPAHPRVGFLRPLPAHPNIRGADVAALEEAR